MRRTTILMAAAGLAVAAMTRAVCATPYASTITNSAGTISFYLNENASDVTVVLNGVSQDLGQLNQGQQSFALNGATNYQIVVKNAGSAGFNTFTAAPNFQNGTVATGQFNSIAQLSGVINARSVAVNQDPTTPTFGRIYLGQGTIGLSYTNPDFSGQVFNNGGINYGTSNGAFRMVVGPQGKLYVSDNTDAQSALFVHDPDLNNGTTVLAGIGDSNDAPGTPSVHGSILSQVILSGSPAQGNFVVKALDEDLSYLPGTTTPHSYSQTTTTAVTDPPPANATYNSLWQWNLGSASTNYATPPTKIQDFPGGLSTFHGTTNDVLQAPNGNYFMLVDRSAGTDVPSIYETSPTGTLLWDSWTTTNQLAGSPTPTTVADALRNSNSIALSPDGKELAIAVVAPSPEVYIVPLDASGVPELQEARIIPVGAAPNGRGVAFDAAGNVILVASGDAAAYQISPGGLTQTVYSNNTAGTAGTFTSTQLQPTWTSTTTGDFSNTANWLLNFSPNLTGIGALFGSAITQPTTVNIDNSPTLGSINFNNAKKYTLSSNNGSNINFTTFDPAGVQINDLNGSHEIAVPISLQSNTTVTVTNAADTLTFSGDISYSNPISFTMAGAGTALVKSLNVATLNLNGGTLKLTAPRAQSNVALVNAISVNTGAALDLGNNDLIDDYNNGGSPSSTELTKIMTAIAVGYNGGAWTGKGITSSTAASIAAATSNHHKTALGYAEASTIGGRPDGRGLDNDAIAVVYTWSGDANLDGTVNVMDFNALAGDFNNASGVWTTGDFNYDGKVNASDFDALAANYGQTGLAATGPALGTLVPEPASLSIIGLGATALLGRRRRK